MLFTLGMDTVVRLVFLCGIFVASTVTFTTAGFNSDKILISDLKVITLHQNQMTNARRSSPVPQLKCVGGSAQHKFQPKAVQCINQGSDGYDIQWECKTDMDNSYRFGHVGVSCEGYDYPNDPYVLKGSCGLEYTIEFTEEGLQRERQSGGGGNTNYYYSKNHSEGGIGGLFVFAGILFAIYVMYKTCLAPQHPAGHQHTSSEPSAPPQPPPYGFRPEYMPGQNAPPPSYESCNPNFTNGSSSSGQHRQSPSSGGGGFWSGAATGGILGYMFGRNRNQGYHFGNQWTNHHQPHQDYGNNSGFSSFRPSGSSSSGTRTASGFGGTTRR